jgi:hypothetical protein
MKDNFIFARNLKYLIVFVLLFLPLFNAPHALASNCTNDTPNADCGNAANSYACPTFGSTTFTAIADTAYTSPNGTSIASTDCIDGISYDSESGTCPSSDTFFSGDCLMAFKPHGYANSSLFWILCWHGGGGFGGQAITCWSAESGDKSGLDNYVRVIQECIDLGKPCGVISFNYQLSVSPGTMPDPIFPTQTKDVSCGISWAMANLGSPSTLGYYGPSWGGELSFWAGNVPSSVFGTSSTCLSTDARPAHSITVSAWPLMSWAQPLASAGIDNGDANTTQGIQDALNCSTTAACRTTDSSLNASPYLQITGSNLAQIKSNQQMFQFTSTDQVVEPYWSGNAGGNAVDSIKGFQALGITPLMNIYPNGPSNLNNYNSTGGHEIGLGNIGIASMGDAIRFLLNLNSGGSAGNAGSAGVLSSF